MPATSQRTPPTARVNIPPGANNAVQPGPRSSYAELTPRINSSRAVQEANSAAMPSQMVPKGAGPYKPPGGFGSATLGNVASNPGTATNTYNHPAAARINPAPPPDPRGTPKTNPKTAWNNAARAGASYTVAKSAAIEASLGRGQVVGAFGAAVGAAGAHSMGEANGKQYAQGWVNRNPVRANADIATTFGANIPFSPGSAPGYGATATAAAAAGAAAAALGGWLDSGNIAPPASGSETFGFGTLTVNFSAQFGSGQVSTPGIREDFVLDKRLNYQGWNFWYFAVWPSGEAGLVRSNSSFLNATVANFTLTNPGSPQPQSRPEPSEQLSNPPSTRGVTLPRLPSPLGDTPKAPLNLPGLKPPPTEPEPEREEEPITPQIPPETLPPNHPLAPEAPPENPEAPETEPPPAEDPSDVPKKAPPQRTTTDPTGDPGQDEKETPWWQVPPIIPAPIPPGQKINDPTTPGQFTKVEPPKKAPPTDTPTDNPCKCNGPLLSAINGNNAATQAQLARIEDNQNNPVSGFAALQVGQAGILGLLQSVNTFMRKAWEMTRMQKVLDALTFIAVMHNVAMLSRNVGDTFFELISQALNVIGIEDENGSPLDVNGMVAGGIETFLRSVLGNDIYEGTRDTWNKASRILSSASMVIWTIRSIADTSLDLMEWIGENVSKIGNALKAWGVVGENAYRGRWMSERAEARNRLRSKFDRVTGALDATEERLETFTIATSAVIELQDETGELAENFGRFKDSVENGIPDPWVDNVPVATEQGNAKTVSQSPAVTATDAER